MQSLQDVLNSHPDAVGHFYNDTKPKNFRLSAAGAALLQPEYTNWRDEQRAWRESAVLFDQSHIMPELYISGPDSVRLLERVAVNSVADWPQDRAKQIVACAPNGYLIGDCIAYRLGESEFELVSGGPLLNWIAYQAEASGFDVKVESDPLPLGMPVPRRRRYRFQLLGPHTAAILDDVVEGGTPEIAFFRTAPARVADRDVLILRHGMAGVNGVELSGSYDDLERVKGALLAAGQSHGLRVGGSRAYYSTLVESGWMAYPLPAIFTDPGLEPYRSWLPGDGWEANVAPGGSLEAASLDDYYLTPWELGYGRIVNFDHDFIGRDALWETRDATHRKKVTLSWNVDDVTRVMASDFRGPHHKSLELPVVYFGSPQADEVRSLEGDVIGVSSHAAFTVNAGSILSLAVLEPQSAVPGTEVALTWGEPDGGSRKSRVEPHEQTVIRATVTPVPFPSTSVRGAEPIATEK